MNEFDLEPYMDDSMPQSSDVDASPASFNPAAGFSEVFCDPAICQFGDLSNSEFIWDIPQLQTEEKNSAKIPEGLAYAVNAAISVKSSYDNMKVIEDKYFNFFIWKIVTNYVYQRLAKKFGLPFLGQPIHKIRKCKKCKNILLRV